MEAVFLKILQMSLTAGYVILAVAAVRLLLRRAPKKYSYLLWAAAAFRLLCPVSFSSVFSLFRLGAGPQRHTTVLLPQNTPVTVTLPQNVVTTQPVAPVHSVVPDVETAAAQEINWLAVAMVVWLLGMLVMTVWALVSHVRLRRRLRTAVLLRENIRQSESVRSPFILGIFRPQIYIPYGLTEPALSHVLAHERYHLRCGDHLVRLMAYGLLTVHWFNPLVWAAWFLMSRDMEMRCDEAVLRRAEDRISYSETLLSFAANRRIAVVSPLAFGESSVRSRIQNALRWKRPGLWLTVAAAAICILVVAACSADPKEPLQEKPSEEMTETEQPGETPPQEAPPEEPPQVQPVPETPAQQTEEIWVARETMYLAGYSSWAALQGNSGFLYVMSENSFHMYLQNTGEPLISQRISLLDWELVDSDHTCWKWLSEAGLEPEQYTEVLYLDLAEQYFLLKLDGKLCAGSGYDRTGLWDLYALQPYNDPSRCELYNDSGHWLLDMDRYAGEYDYKHYNVSTLKVRGDLALQLNPTWECSELTVIMDYYEARNGTRVSDLQEVTLQRDENGSFVLPVDHRHEEDEEQLIIRVPYEGGEYVVRIELQGKTRDPLEATDWYLQELESYAGHEILAHHTLAVCGDGGSSHEETTVYALTAFYLEDTQLVYWLPTVLDFWVDGDGCGCTGFWTPEEYKVYLPQIEEMFPKVDLDAAETEMLRSRALWARIDHLLITVYAYGDMFPDMDGVRDAFSDEYAELLSYGDSTLLYVYDKFLNGNETGVRGEFMRLLLDELTGYPMDDRQYENGQDYFNAWLLQARKDAEQNGEAWMKTNYPKVWLLLEQS